jgi:hypothetical protein
VREWEGVRLVGKMGERRKKNDLKAGGRTKNSTRQLHESFVIKWMCKCECRTHRERSFVIKN